MKNTGKVAGKEVVQMYLQDVVGSTTRPVRELKGFEKISLEPGEFIVSVGSDSRTKNSASFVLK